MADMSTNLCGVMLPNPFILASGPLSYGAAGLIAATAAGAAAVVTKTIRRDAAVNPVPHIADNGRGSLLNCEKWSDLDARQWIEQEIPRAKAGGVKVLIASVGGPAQDIPGLVGSVVEAGSDLVEVVGGYTNPAELVETIAEVARISRVPVLVKVNANWPDVADTATQCIGAGAQGITAIDSIGPVLRLDVRTGRPMLGGKNGYGWLSGTAIKPMALRVVADVARRNTVSLVGTGGVTTAADALEMLLAGATAIGVCSAAILRGLGVFQQLATDLGRLLDEYSYGSVAGASGVGLRYLPTEDTVNTLQFTFAPDRCSECGRCVTVCSYRARAMSGKGMSLNERICRRCGVCVSVCPTGALQGGTRS